ncbi:hypothetical protein quinque_016139 [Culex quinquefasciatus]
MADSVPIRKNTFVIDFTMVPRQVKDNEVVQFMEEVLRMTYEHVVSMQPRRNLIFVETPDLDCAQGYVDDHDGKHAMRVDDQEYAVRLYMEDGAINVKVRDLPPQWKNDLIVKTLMQYGKVVAIKDDLWEVGFVKGKKNGTRTVRMVVKKPIPSYVLVASEQAFVSYPNQQHTCKSCSKPVHPNKKCSEMKEGRKSVGDRLEQAQSSIDLTADSNESPYASAITTGSAPVNLNRLNDAHRESLKRPSDVSGTGDMDVSKQPLTLLDLARNLAKTPRQEDTL